jgi:hypothetical protein
MGWVSKDKQRWRSPEQVTREVHEVSLARGLDNMATVLAVMCIAQESDFWCPANHADPVSFNYRHDSVSNDGRSVGYFQQQNKVPGENPTGPGENWWGTMASRMDLKRSANEFLDRLSDDYHTDNPAAASELISNVQRPREDLRGAYAKHWGRAWDLVNALGPVKPVPPPPVPAKPPTPGVQPKPDWRGDPVFLPELLRGWGMAVQEYPGWRERGHGDFNRIWGVVAHHTGSFGETPKGIAEHPSLGLASQLYLGRNGEVVICGAGVAWHAGRGGWPGIPADSANQVTIGIEAANDGGGSPGKPHRSSWSNAQYEAYTTLCAAILWFLGLGSDRVISHRDWAGAAQGKWDPGAIDMKIFRTDIQRKIDAGPPGGGGQQQQEDGDVPLVSQRSGSIYRESNAVLPWQGTPLDFIMDAHIHEGRVEALATCGVSKALALVKAVAEGKSPVNADLSDDDRAQAQAVLDYINSMN